MTVDELLAREAIRDLMARYTTSGDRLKVDEFVACFAEDGVIESERAPGDFIFRYAGREAIRAWQSRWRERPAERGRVHRASFVRHHLATSRIELTGANGARGRTYWVAWTDIGPDHAGYYLDDFSKIGDEWLIAKRRVRVDWMSVDSLFDTAIEHSSG